MYVYCYYISSKVTLDEFKTDFDTNMSDIRDYKGKAVIIIIINLNTESKF